MRSRNLFPAALLLIAGLPAVADVRVREFHVQPLAAVDTVAHEDRGPRVQAIPESNAEPSEVMALYPVAGTFGRDIAIPYYVDLDPTGGKLDWNCTDLTFNNHMGHDAYVRSFAEQRIGVPVFAVRDGRVIDVRDNQPDENMTNDSTALPNTVVIRHDEDEITQYVHLRKGILVHLGDTIAAGTQIGWIGSSGMSMGPHIHFEARVGDVAYEPMAGPCRPGRSYFADQPTLFEEPMVLGTTFSNHSFGDYAPAPQDDAPHVSTFVAGPQTIWFKTELANVGASTRYKLLLEKPGSTQTEVASMGTLKTIDVSLASIWWGLDVDLDTTGTWAMVLEVNERRLFSVPFTVVSQPSEVVNRAPSPVSASFEPVALRIDQVAQCRASTATFPDPDYDVVRYRYEWRVNGAVVRDVTTAAQSDALPRQYMTANSDVSCSITPSDGTATAQTVTVHGTPVNNGRRRAVRF
jgi:hypothetical protein